MLAISCIQLSSGRFLAQADAIVSLEPEKHELRLWTRRPPVISYLILIGPLVSPLESPACFESDARSLGSFLKSYAVKFDQSPVLVTSEATKRQGCLGSPGT